MDKSLGDKMKGMFRPRKRDVKDGQGRFNASMDSDQVYVTRLGEERDRVFSSGTRSDGSEGHFIGMRGHSGQGKSHKLKRRGRVHSSRRNENYDRDLPSLPSAESSVARSGAKEEADIQSHPGEPRATGSESQPSVRQAENSRAYLESLGEQSSRTRSATRKGTSGQACPTGRREESSQTRSVGQGEEHGSTRRRAESARPGCLTLNEGGRSKSTGRQEARGQVAYVSSVGETGLSQSIGSRLGYSSSEEEENCRAQSTERKDDNSRVECAILVDESSRAQHTGSGKEDVHREHFTLVEESSGFNSTELQHKSSQNVHPDDEDDSIRADHFEPRDDRGGIDCSEHEDDDGQADRSDLEDESNRGDQFEHEGESSRAAYHEGGTGGMAAMRVYSEQAQEQFGKAYRTLEEMVPSHDWSELLYGEGHDEVEGISRVTQVLDKICLLVTGFDTLKQIIQQRDNRIAILSAEKEAYSDLSAEHKAAHRRELDKQEARRQELEERVTKLLASESNLTEQIRKNQAYYKQAESELESTYQNGREKMNMEFLERMNAALDEQDRAHERQVHETEENHRKEIEKQKRDNWKECNDVRATLSTTLSTTKREHEKQMQKQADEHRRQMDSAKRDHDHEMQTLSARHRLEKKDMSVALTQQKKEAEMEQERWNSDTVELERKHNEELRMMRQQARELRADLQKTHAREQQRLKDHAETVHRSLKKDLETQIEQLQAELTEVKRRHDQEQDNLREQTRKAQADMERAHAEEQQLLRNNAEKAHASLKRDIRSRNNALVAREKFNQLTDGQLMSKFTELVHLVDALARLNWRYNQSAWTDELQSQLSDAPKRLRKQILQDTIWGILFEKVFCSPFRMLGDEGERLETQWLKDFGAGMSFPPLERLHADAIHPGASTGDHGYIWPEPSYDSERWRYETLRQCQEALNKPMSDYDPRQRLRKGCLQSVARVREDMSQALGNVSSVDATTVRSVESIAEKAIKMWVLFGTQRCRLVIASRGSKVTTEAFKVHPSRERCVELAVRPELKRIGDADGVLFEGETTIAGCVGEVIKILY